MIGAWPTIGLVVASSTVVESPESDVRRTARPLQVIVLSVPVLVLALMSWHYRWVYDDGFIYLRIARNLIAGNGPVFNEGERVEAYTGPLWLFLVTLASWPWPQWLPWVAVLLGIAATTGSLVLATVAGVRIARAADPSRAFLLPVGSALFASTAAVWSFASAGMENGLAFLWLGLCLLILVRWAAAGTCSRWGWIVLGLGPLIRPELTMASAVFLVAVLAGQWRDEGWSARMRHLGWALALPVAYQIFRMAYFGQVVANTAVAKEGTLPRPGLGWFYLQDFLRPYWMQLPMLLLLLGGLLPLALRLPDRRWLLAALALPTAGLLNAGFVVLMGGDYIHGRLLLPAFFALTAPVAVLPLKKAYVAGLLVTAYAAANAIWLRPVPGLRPPVSWLVGEQRVTAADNFVQPGIPPWWQGPGLYASFSLRPNQFQRIDVPLRPGLPGTVMVTGGIGLPPYAAPLDFGTYDVLGLADPLAAHMLLTRRGLPGHEKEIPMPWVIAQLTPPDTPTAPFDAVQAGRDGSGIPALLPFATGQELQQQTESARQALTCPRIRALVEAPREPLTVTRALTNLRDSWSTTRLRIPADPAQAIREFCPG